jgi:thiol-disulfide isomerase/thioredoxin
MPVMKRIAPLLLLLAPFAAALQEPPPAAPAPAALSKPYQVGSRVTDEIRLPDLAGREHALLAENEGRALVLVFWSFQDPVSRAYLPLLEELAEQRAERLRLVLIDSNHDELTAGAADPLDKIRRHFEQEKIALPLLLDRGNRLADDFGAIANGHAFLLDANRILRYQGGIDDDPRGERRKLAQPVKSWLAEGIDLVLRGEKIERSETWTRPAGRPIKRAPSARKPG